MEVFAVPDAVKQHPKMCAGDITFVSYRETGSLLKNMVVFNQYAISFVLNGQKEIYRSTENTVIKAGQAMLIPEGNSIIAEHSPNRNQYHSLVIFFPGHLAANLLDRHHIALDKALPPHNGDSFIHFSSTGYLNEYLRGIQALIATGHQLSYPIALHKLEELLLVIYELFPTQLVNLFSRNRDSDKLSLKSLVEKNLFSKLTLDELAFLANRSLSSFKRDFEKTYGIAPQKYIRDRKLEVASAELISGKQATEIFDAYGYENLSNFNTAFKKKFGVTPASYKNTATLNVLQ
ncbi:helix-turn-helix transcriptional regulator [Mucilaginibacter sp. HMF5004]|uniref:helix-turn-helix domain-containing protein n=1 Tax=Mucilaginibacter rivuli TaxID=2857527 RepID=UPI001C5ED6BB|nr:helix-turn-helix transcriptional regulator [Mucilaginibacter rivuli]MBW4888832.1 helix-turn-helix transcriptional regulator [Mucilaginibacter rivuli]